MLKSLIALAVLGTLAGCAAQTPRQYPDLANTDYIFDKAVPTCTPTGTRIRQTGSDCQPLGPGRSYSKDDLDRTGAFTPAEALRMLDPAFTR